MSYEMPLVRVHNGRMQLCCIASATDRMQMTWSGLQGVVSWDMIYTGGRMWIRMHAGGIPSVITYACETSPGGLHVSRINPVGRIITSLQLAGLIGNNHIGLYLNAVSGTVCMGHVKSNIDGTLGIAVMDLDGADTSMNGLDKEYDLFAWFGWEEYVIHVYVKLVE
ncbi:hypothetical protein CC86DRAFT_459472 [Ophiobolus disseminans]|uniref:Uncharacterized protein n=1 Tax=Ophiobolus disseminans TaxID=1469910 RepID=A0A6A6ZJ40_9PLEO|nr:hypothetical protein CC86DRAFT_459472 [Ophiobolus disseminans]